jgi:hypothetical protein
MLLLRPEKSNAGYRNVYVYLDRRITGTGVKNKFQHGRVFGCPANYPKIDKT